MNAGLYVATLQRLVVVQGTMSRVCFRSTNADLFRGRHDRHTIRIRRLISGVMGAFPRSFKKITAERILTYHRAYSLRQLIKSAAQIGRLGANQMRPRSSVCKLGRPIMMPIPPPPTAGYEFLCRSCRVRGRQDEQIIMQVSATIFRASIFPDSDRSAGIFGLKPISYYCLSAWRSPRL